QWRQDCLLSSDHSCMSFPMKNPLLCVAIGLVHFGYLLGQSGFVHVLDFGVKRTYACNLALKGFDQIFVCGIYLHENNNIQGLFASRIDTNGTLLRTDYFEDQAQRRSLDFPDFGEVGVAEDGNILMQVAYL